MADINEDIFDKGFIMGWDAAIKEMLPTPKQETDAQAIHTKWSIEKEQELTKLKDEVEKLREENKKMLASLDAAGFIHIPKWKSTNEEDTQQSKPKTMKPLTENSKTDIKELKNALDLAIAQLSTWKEADAWSDEDEEVFNSLLRTQHKYDNR